MLQREEGIITVFLPGRGGRGDCKVERKKSSEVNFN